jgi:nitrogen regulatory protein PII
MTPVKRVEIITGAPHAERIIRLLEDNEVSGYTLIHHVQGKGERGMRDGDGLSDAFENIMIIVACSGDDLEEFAADITAILKRIGGVMLVSDALWVK